MQKQRQLNWRVICQTMYSNKIEEAKYMAKTMYTIEMNYRNACKQAEELEQIAHNLNVLAEKDFEVYLLGIAAAWKGENSSVFCKKGYILQNDIKNSAEDLRKAAAAIRKISQNVYNTEKQNLEIAQRRSY